MSVTATVLLCFMDLSGVFCGVTQMFFKILFYVDAHMSCVISPTFDLGIRCNLIELVDLCTAMSNKLPMSVSPVALMELNAS